MSEKTQAFFIVSSGRSETAMLHKALVAAGDVEMHHEYMVQITQPLAALLPEAKFVHLVSDGRKVAGSFFCKLAAERYDDRSTVILQAFLDDPA